MEQTYECNAIGLFVDCELNEERPRAYKKGGQIRVVKCGAPRASPCSLPLGPWGGILSESPRPTAGLESKGRETFRHVGIANDARQGLVQEAQLYGRRRFFKLDNALEKGWGKAGLSHSVP